MATQDAEAIDLEALDIDAPEAPLPDPGPDDDAAPASVKAGAAAIRSYWKHAPKGPGVYRMIGADEAVLYVGKAKSVRKRIASYMRPSGHTNRIARMIALTQSMMFVSTATETEALLLETNLIKQLKPRFNVLMRDDKSFPYILLTGDHAAPQILKHRGARSRKGDYFGPFASVWAVNRTLNALERAFLLRSCSDSYYDNRTRPCLLHQIKRCSAPCTGEITAEDYAGLVKDARAFLTGKSRAVRDLLATEMGAASETLDFERAARLRDRIAALSAIQGEQGVNPKTTEEADVFAVIEQAGQFCIEAVFFRTYQNWGNRGYFPKAERSLAPAEVLESFLAQFYADRPPPRLVLLSHDFEDRALLEMALSERYGAKVEIAVPQRGEKRDLVEHATSNAKQTLGRTLSETASQEKLLAALAEAFGLERRLRRVEVYDNSHIMGTNAVGAMVVAGAGGFMKMHYRTFNIKDEALTPGDDFGMMREVLRRRFARLNKEAPAATKGEAEAPRQARLCRDRGASHDHARTPGAARILLLAGREGTDAHHGGWGHRRLGVRRCAARRVRGRRRHPARAPATDRGSPPPPLRGGGYARRRDVPGTARPHPDRRRSRPVQCHPCDPGRTRRHRCRRGRHRQRPRPRRRPRDVLRAGQGAVPAVAARPGALLRAAATRRGAPLRHRNPSCAS